MKLSYSRIGCFKTCPYQYRMRYMDKLKTLMNDDPQNALILGHALHTGIEKDVADAVGEYYNAYPIITDRHIEEAMKLEYLIPKAKEMLPSNGIHELEIGTDDFKGFLDLLIPVEEYEGTAADEGGYSGGKIYDLYDFKYSKNVDRYMSSEQLHLYKYFFELTHPNEYIRNLYFMFIPKVQIKLKKDEELYEFRQRIMYELEQSKVQIKEVKYDPTKVITYLIDAKHAIECEEYNKNEGYLCNWCEYQGFCQKGNDYMILPKNERVEVNAVSFMKGWIYGQPFSGKTTFMDSAPSPLNLNTDGNTKYVTMQRLRIRDEVTVTGRITNTKLAWEVLKDAIAELEKGSEFETIIVDLVEDTREMCRIYMYNKLKIQHESDSGYGKGWDIIKTEYLSTMRRLLNLDYNIFLLSHEDVSKDITKSSGEKITAIKPNIQEAIANKLAGMVDFVARIVVNDDGSRVLSFKQNEVIFGGGRLNIMQESIPLEWNALMNVYEEAKVNATEKNFVKPEAQKRTSRKSKNDEVVEDAKEPVEEPTTRTRKTREDVEPTFTDEDPTPSEPVEETSVKRERKSRTTVPSEETETVGQPVDEKPTRRKRVSQDDEKGSEGNEETSTPVDADPKLRRRRRVVE